MSVIAFSPAIGPVAINVVISEKHLSELAITTNPIEFGADVTDHAYPEPKRVTLRIADVGGAATWQALVRFQESRVPFTLVTGLDVYKDMLVRNIEADRDKDQSSILSAAVDLQQVIIVDTAYTSGVDGESVSKAGQPGGEKSSRAARLSPSRSKGAVTADRASGTVKRGDNPTVAVPAARNQSILNRAFQ